MPFTFGIPLGLLIVLVGGAVFFITKQKRFAIPVVAIGLAITLLTVLMIVIISASPM